MNAMVDINFELITLSILVLIFCTQFLYTEGSDIFLWVVALSQLLWHCPLVGNLHLPVTGVLLQSWTRDFSDYIWMKLLNNFMI